MPIMKNPLKTTIRIDPKLLKTVFSIEQQNKNGNYSPIGTGFLIFLPNGIIGLVTARHVVSQWNYDTQNWQIKDKLGFRFNQIEAQSIVTPDIDLSSYLGTSWHMFKELESHDIAIKPILLPMINKGTDTLTISPNMALFKDQIGIGAPITILGFPMGIRNENYPTPIARFGKTSLIDQNHIICDCTSFPGNSGGPAFYHPSSEYNIKEEYETEIKLLGIVTSYILYEDTAISIQTNRPKIVFAENTGLTNIVPLDYLIPLMQSQEFLHDLEKLNQYLIKNQHLPKQRLPITPA